MRPFPRVIPGLSERLAELRGSLAIDASPRNVMRVAEAHWIAGRADEAARLLEPLVSISPGAIAPRVLLSWCYEDVGRPQESMLASEAALALDPANPFLRPDTAPADAVPAKPQPQPEYVAQIVSAAPTPVLDAERLAEPEAALTAEELRAIPPSGLLSATLGEIFERQGFDEKAIEIYREVVRRNPEREDLLARIEALEARAAGNSPS